MGEELGKLRGHWAKFDEKNKEFRYCDNNQPAYDRPCGNCGREVVGDYDPCLGHLPGVISACCGHGDASSAHVVFPNGVILRGFTVERTVACRGWRYCDRCGSGFLLWHYLLTLEQGETVEEVKKGDLSEVSMNGHHEKTGMILCCKCYKEEENGD